MKIHESITQERLVAALEEDHGIGFCIACGAEVDGIEPDTREGVCDICEQPKVFGAEELLIERTP